MYRNRKYRAGVLVPVTSNLSGSQVNEGTQPINSALVSISNSVTTPNYNPLPSTSQSVSVHYDPGVSEAKKKKVIEPISASQEDDMFCIPSSQNPTQSRFSSQRSILARTQSILMIGRQPKNYFENVLIKCGVGLESMDCYVLTCNHLCFVTKIRDVLKESDNFPENIKDFISGLDDTMKSYMTLTKLFSGCKLSLPSSDNIYQSQESLVKDFLTIDFLQKDLIEILFNKISTFVEDDKTLELEVPYVELILSELKFLNIVEHGDAVLNKIFGILESATLKYQQIIIRSFPDIIDTTRHNEAMEKLMRLIPEDDSLLAFSNVDTFGNMQLNGRILGKLRNKIIDHMKYKTSHELFSSFVQFILRMNRDEMETLTQLISDLRHCLRWRITAENQEEMKVNQMKVFQCIVRSLSASKHIYDIWLKTIQSTTRDDQKSIDFIILIIMIKVNEDKAYYIEQLIRKKIKSEMYNVTMLDDMANEFEYILMEYLTVFISILDSFFRDKTPSIVAFASHGFKILFRIEDCCKKVLLTKLVGYVCQNQHGSDKANPVIDVPTNALRILTGYNETNPQQMQKHGLQLLRLLDRASELTITQCRMVMNILCSIAYPLPPMKGTMELQNHIDMLLKKQVSSSILAVKNLGIVGVVQTIENLIWTNETNESIESTDVFDTIDDIVDIPAKTAAQYLDMILSATRNSPESIGLCFDELAAVFSMRNKNNRKKLIVNKSFEIWLSDFIIGVFQDLFVTDEVPNYDIECEYQYSLNSDDENNTNSDENLHIAVNIAGLTFKASSNPIGSILLLSSSFNLLRILQFYRYGHLISINALLGCSIILPKCMNSASEMDIFDDFNEARATKILDIYYFTVNWMRETISAFVTQNDENMRKKTIIRLSELIKLEEKIKNLLQFAPSNYIPPVCQFNSSPIKANSSKKPSAGQSKHLKKPPIAPETNVESENITLFNMLPTQKSVANVTHRSNAKNRIYFNSLNYGSKEIFRQMDPDIIRLLDQELMIKYPIPSEKVGEVIGLKEFKFLMDDLVIKLESVFDIKQFVSDQPLQYVVCPSDLVSDLIKFLPQIMTFFNQLMDHLKQFLNDAKIENKYTELYTVELNYTKICIGLCLRLLAAFFTWPNFQMECNQQLLRDSLVALVQVPESEKELTTSELAEKAIETIIGHSTAIWDLQSAVHMFHLIRSLSLYSKISKTTDRVVDVCKEFLSRKWYGYDGTLERGGHSNLLLDELLKGLLKSASFPRIQNLLKTVKQEITKLCSKHDSMTSFPNFYKSNAALLYRSICAAVIVLVNDQLGKSGPTFVQLKIWDKSSLLLKSLAEIVSVIDIPRNYGIFLKHAHIYIKIFLHHGIPLVQSGLRSSSEQILIFLKNIDYITKFLHKICCHWKAKQNTGIMAQVPFVRETIETLLIKVKALLAANKCSAAFWMANLKNKDLHDEEILSQTTSEDNDENDEELPEDDNSLEDECLQYDRDGSRETTVETTVTLSKTNSDGLSRGSFRSLLI